jgi:MoaA/NifB/PqqE/SkfB family radical SAM enzyme
MDISRLLVADAKLAAMAAALRREPDAPFPILSAKIKLTWHCNLRCRMCMLWQRAAEGLCGRGLPERLVCGTLDRLRGQGLRKVHFSGGEVMLYDGLREVILHSVGLGLQVNLTTNGTRVDREAARFLVDEGVHAVTVSIDDAAPRRHDALRGVPGAWKAAWKGIDRLQHYASRKGRGPVVAVNTLITRENIERLDAMHELLVRRGIARWRLLPIDTEDRALLPTHEQWRALAGRWDAWRPLLGRLPLAWRADRPDRSAHRAGKGCYAGDFYSDQPCFAPWFNLFIDANGAVYPCCMGKGHMQTYGNLLVDSLDAALRSTARREILAGMSAGRAFDICRCCDDFLEENAVFRHAGRRRAT